MDARDTGPRRLLVVLAGALFVFSVTCGESLQAQGGDQRYRVPPREGPPPREVPPPTEHPPSGSSRGKEWLPWVIAGGVIGAVAIASRANQANAHVDEDALGTNGPRFPDSYTVGTFAVQGYFGGGWPIVIDYFPQPSTCTWLEVSIDQTLRVLRPLDRDGSGGRRLVRIDVGPEYLPKGARSAVYAVHSVHPTCPEGRKIPSDDATPSPVEVYGIGAGPRAVGSVAIDELQFGPDELRFPQDRATIAYRAASEFNHASVEILRYSQEPSGQINVDRVSAQRVAVVPGQNQGAPWGGKGESGGPSLGMHRLQVRAWYTENDKSWVGAISPASVYVVKQ